MLEFGYLPREAGGLGMGGGGERCSNAVKILVHEKTSK